jgi:hypothetical protein
LTQVTGIGITMGIVFFIISFLVGYFWIDSIIFLVPVLPKLFFFVWI